MSNKAHYRQLSTQLPGLSVFAQPWWLDVVCADWDAAIATKGDMVTGVWPYPIEKKMGVAMLRTPALTPYLGPHVFFPADLKASKADNYEHNVVTELATALPDVPVWHLAVAPGMQQVGIFNELGLRAEVQQTFVLDLQPDEAVLLGNMQDSMKRNLKQPDDGMTIAQAPDALPELYDFYSATLTRKGKTPIDKSRLSKLWEQCRKHNAGMLWAAKEAGKVTAIIWQVWDQQCSYYLLGAQNPDATGYKAMSHLLWHAMRHARQSGLRSFDLEGSMDPGVERFFRGFSGQRKLYLILKKDNSALWKLKKAVKG